MPRQTDIVIANAALDRLGPGTQRLREQIDRGHWRGDPEWCARALNVLGEEDLQLEARESARRCELEREGTLSEGDRESRRLRAARLRLRQTVAEISMVALENCLASPQDTSAARGLFLRQQAELWSARTGFGDQRRVLEHLPAPNGRRWSQEALARTADVLAALKVAETDVDRGTILKEAEKNGFEAKELKALLEGKAVVDEALDEAVSRRVAVLEEERNRDPAFLSFLILNGWIGRALKSMP